MKNLLTLSVLSLAIANLQAAEVNVPTDVPSVEQQAIANRPVNNVSSTQPTKPAVDTVNPVNQARPTQSIESGVGNPQTPPAVAAKG